MDAVLASLKREPTFTAYLYGQWAKIPNVIWLLVFVVELLALSAAQNV